MTREQLRKKVSERKTMIREWYHQYHRIPELGMEEKETTQQICKHLEEMGITPIRLDPTGVTAYIGPQNAYTIGLRADIDGLFVTEETGLPFQSQHPGKMHACGHDGHIAGLLGAASILKELEEELTVRVKLIFQPSEENVQGARSLLSQGILNGVDEIFGLHLFSDIETGCISIEPGPRMAQTDRFAVRLTGKGGHAGKPHQCIDATVMAAELILSLQTIVAREIDPLQGAVITVGSLRSGTQYNVISQEACLEGTCRSYTKEVADRLHESICRKANAIAEAYGGNAEISYEQESHPPVYNDPVLTDRIAKEAEQLLEDRKLIHTNALMLGEDFSWYQKQIPGVFAFVGCKKSEGKSYLNHHPKFEINEEALSDGVFLHLAAVFSAMHQKKELT